MMCNLVSLWGPKLGQTLLELKAQACGVEVPGAAL